MSRLVLRPSQPITAVEKNSQLKAVQLKRVQQSFIRDPKPLWVTRRFLPFDVGGFFTRLFFF